MFDYENIISHVSPVRDFLCIHLINDQPTHVAPALNESNVILSSSPKYQERSFQGVAVCLTGELRSIVSTAHKTADSQLREASQMVPAGTGLMTLGTSLVAKQRFHLVVHTMRRFGSF